MRPRSGVLPASWGAETSGACLVLGLTVIHSTRSAVLDADSHSDLAPGSIFLTLQAPPVDRRYRQGAVVEKGADIVDRLTGVPPELRRGVTQDLDACGSSPNRLLGGSRSDKCHYLVAAWSHD